MLISSDLIGASASEPDSETASWAVIKGSSGIGFKGLLQRGAT